MDERIFFLSFYYSELPHNAITFLPDGLFANMTNLNTLYVLHSRKVILAAAHLLGF